MSERKILTMRDLISTPDVPSDEEKRHNLLGVGVISWESDAMTEMEVDRQNGAEVSQTSVTPEDYESARKRPKKDNRRESAAGHAANATNQVRRLTWAYQDFISTFRIFLKLSAGVGDREGGRGPLRAVTDSMRKSFFIILVVVCIPVLKEEIDEITRLKKPL